MPTKLDVEAIRKVILDNAEQVTYTPADHRYFMDNAEVPGVTRLLRPITDDELKNIPPDRLEMARQRGTSGHEAIDKYISTGFDFSKGEMKQYMVQVKRFLSEHNVIIIAHEVKVRNYIYGVAGRADGVAIIDDEDIIRPVDYKFTFEVHPSVAIQLNMYESCLYSYKLGDAHLPVGEGVVVHFELNDYQLVPAWKIADRDVTVAAAKGLVSVNTFKTMYCKRK